MQNNATFRTMRRFKQQLTEQACEEILQGAYRGFLSVNGENGYPYTIPINFFYRNKHVYFHSALQGHKMDAIKKSAKVCFTVINEPVKQENDWWYHVSSVVCFGQMSIIEDQDERMEILKSLGKKYFPEGYDMEKDLKMNAHRAAVLCLAIEHITGKRVKEN
ncbi:MAG: pyridoxamine 5'-phosphate oxidase family protein [Paludibacteraceae bacterium]|jgi:nitroimidazol reductase NimA-like FMN-containing flavoprotein (pyridoxamine 5'-phosphate oxidase superfamily)|nr:pyridoxamine 5'-phosphate oxidase family protein [Paludibacteraceae bacterium]